MRLTELATLTGAQLAIMYSEHLGAFCAYLVGAEIMEGVSLRGNCGYGLTPDLALAALAKELAGTRIVFDAYRNTRREFSVPPTLNPY